MEAPPPARSGGGTSGPGIDDDSQSHLAFLATLYFLLIFSHRCLCVSSMFFRDVLNS